MNTILYYIIPYYTILYPTNHITHSFCRLAQERKQEHENWLAEQKRHIAALRVQKALAREIPMFNQQSQFNSNSNNNSNNDNNANTLYDPATGFKIFWDYATNLPLKKGNTKLFKTRIAHCMYQGVNPFTKIKGTIFFETELTQNQDKNLCIYANNKAFTKVSPLLEMVMILEVQFAGDDGERKPKGKSLGWCALPLFFDTIRSHDPSLKRGNLKLALHSGAFSPAAMKQKVEDEKAKKIEAAEAAAAANDDGKLAAELAEKSRLENSSLPTIFVRVRHANENNEQFTIDPDCTQHMYKTLDEAEVAEKEKEKDNNNSNSNSNSNSNNNNNNKKERNRNKPENITQQQSNLSQNQNNENKSPKQKSNSRRNSFESDKQLDKKLKNAMSKDSFLGALKKKAESTTQEEADNNNSSDDDEIMSIARFEEMHVGVKSLDVLPHSEIPDKKGEISISIEYGENANPNSNLDDFVYTTTGAKPKGLVYTYKRQAMTVENGTRFITFHAMINNGSIFHGTLSLLNDKNSPHYGDHQISMRRSSGGGKTHADEAAAYLRVNILGENREHDTQSEVSHSSRTSRRSLKNRRKKGGNVQPSVQEEDLDELDNDVVDDMSDQTGEEPWINYQDVKNKAKNKFENGDGFDVYLDGARFLPDNSTVTKVSLKAYTQSGKHIGGDDELAFCDLGGSLLSPKFNLRKEFRGDQFDPTSTLMIRVDTFDNESQKARAVGYTLLNLFTEHKNREKQPDNANAQEFSLNTGCFQIPLHKKAPDVKKLIANQLDAMPRVSCSTVLVRIVMAPKSDDGLTVLSRSDFEEGEWEKNKLVSVAPDYGPTGVYDSTRCVPMGVEERLYQVRKHRMDMPLREYVLKELQKIDPEKDISR